jgi:two-component system response regulator
MLQILIVDDSGEDRALAQRVLTQCKILNPIHLVSSAADCITTLQNGIFRPKENSAQRFLVLLDLAMSPHNGHWVLREAATRNLMDSVIFVMLSGIAGIRDVHQGYQLGAKTFLIKPLKAEDVLELLNAVKGKIRLEEFPTGYLLHWVDTTAPVTTLGTPDTSFMRTSSSSPHTHS